MVVMLHVTIKKQRKWVKKKNLDTEKKTTTTLLYKTKQIQKEKLMTE